MPFEKVDINSIKLDKPALSNGGFEPVDIKSIKLDQAPQYSTREAVGLGLSAGQIPFANRITSSLAAAATAPFIAQQGETIPQAYGRLYDEAQQYAKNVAEQKPGAYLAGNLLGAATTLPAAFSSGGASLSGVRGALNQGFEGVTNLAGKVASYSPFKGSGLAARAGNLFTRMGGTAAVAAPVSGAYFAGEAPTGQMGQEFVKGAGLGAAVGAAVPVAGAVLGGAAATLAPKIDEGLQNVAELAQKYDIPVSLDQITTSKPIKTAQKVSQELPFSGVGPFRDQQIGDWQQALMKTVGVDSRVITPEVMDQAFSKVGKQFDDLGRGKSFKIGEDFANQVNEILSDAQITAKEGSIANFNKALEKVYTNMAPDGTISGERLSLLRQELNRLSRKASDSDTVELLKDLENVVIDTMTAGDDAAKGVLSDAKQKYKNLLVIEPIAQKAQGGAISPQLLANRVAKVYGRQYTRGKSGEIGDLARIGRELLPELGGSDTTQKLTAIGAIGTGIIEPTTTAIVVGGNRAVQKLVNQNQKLVNKIINKGKQPAGNVNELPSTRKTPTLPAGAQQSKPIEYVTLPDGTVIPRVNVRPTKTP